MWNYSTIEFARAGPRNNLQRSNFGTVLAATDLKRDERLARAHARKQELPPAIVISWNAKTVTVLCPFCKKKHNHVVTHFARDPGTGRRIQDDNRGWYTYDGPSPTKCIAARCDRDDELEYIHVFYDILFPFEQDSRVAGLFFEVDSDNQAFRTVGSNANITLPILIENPESRGGSEATKDSDLQKAMQKMDLQEAKDDTASDVEVRGIADQLALIASVIDGDLNSLKMNADRSPDSGSLLKTTRRDGTSLLGLAAMHGHLEIVKYLLKCGCDANVTDNQDQTPLMEAALRGYPRIVDTLLKAGANKAPKNRYGMTAGGLAEESEQNDEQRHELRSNYSENPYIKKRHRIFIRTLLGHYPESHISNIAMMHHRDVFQDPHFYKSPSAGTISFVLPSQGVELGQQFKTAAFLNRGGNLPRVIAVSGWIGSTTEQFESPEAGMERLNAGYWAFEALKVASDIG